MQSAITTLEIALGVAKTNEPINRGNGAWEQAELELRAQAEIELALKILRKANAKGAVVIIITSDAPGVVDIYSHISGTDDGELSTAQEVGTRLLVQMSREYGAEDQLMQAVNRGQAEHAL